MLTEEKPEHLKLLDSAIAEFEASEDASLSLYDNLNAYRRRCLELMIVTGSNTNERLKLLAGLEFAATAMIEIKRKEQEAK